MVGATVAVNPPDSMPQPWRAGRATPGVYATWRLPFLAASLRSGQVGDATLGLGNHVTDASLLARNLSTAQNTNAATDSDLHCSAVSVWTQLRVGVFEGLLHPLLNALPRTEQGGIAS